MTIGAPLPPSGWYADPGGDSTIERWWNGQQWTMGLRVIPDVSPPASNLAVGWGPPAPSPSPPIPAAPTAPSPWGRPTSSWPQSDWDRSDWERSDWAHSDSGGLAPTASAEVGQTPLPARTIPTRAAWWGLLGFVVAEIFGILLSGLGYVITGSDTNAVTVLLGEVGLWAGLAGACVFVSRRYGSGSLRRDFSLGFRPVDIGFGVLAAIVGFVLSIFFGALFQHTRFHGSNTQFIAGQKHNSTGFVIAALVASVGAPMFEELFFRGFLRTAFTTRLGATGAIWAQAACFGVAHFEFGTGLGNVSVIVVIGCFGVVLGYTARLTGRLGAGMVAHSLFNAVVTVIILAT